MPEIPAVNDMRTDMRALLENINLAATSIGKLRASLEKRLGLPVGALEEKRDAVNKVLQEELLAKVARDKGSKAKADSEPPAKKAKKKEKKEEKEKAKKADKNAEKEREPDPVEAEPAAEPAAVDSAAAEAAGSAEEYDGWFDFDEPAAQPEEKEVNMGMSAFEDFGMDDFASPQKRSRSQRTWALTGSEDGQVRLWDLDASACVRVFIGHVGAVRALVVDWPGMQAMSGAQDCAKVWDFKGGGCKRTFSEIRGGCTALAVDWEHSRALGGCGDGRLLLWDLKAGKLVKSAVAHVGGVWAVEAEWASQRIATIGDMHLKLWDAGELACLRKVDVRPGSIMTFAMDWSALRALIGSAENSLQMLGFGDVEHPSSRSLPGHTGPVAHVQADWTDKKVAVSGGWDAQLQLWNIAGAQPPSAPMERLEVSFGRVRCMAADFKQMLAVCGAGDGALHFVDLNGGGVSRTLSGHVGAITAVQVKL